MIYQHVILLLLAACCLSGLSASEENAPASGYRGIWYSIGKPNAHGPKYGGGLGTYPANMFPMATYDQAAKRTFFVYGGTSADDRHDLQIMIGAYDHQRGLVSRPTTIRDSQGFKDAHANPAICLGPDGHIYVFSATRHSFQGRIYRSRQPHDHSAFEVVFDRGFIAYPQPWYHPKIGFVLLHTQYQGGKRFLYSMRSKDGSTWDEPKPHATFNGHYQNSMLFPDGSIGTAFNHHPKGVNTRTNIYYLSTPDGGQTWTTVDGQPVQTPLTGPDNAALALDAAGRDELVYIMDLAVDHTGKPVILYLTSSGSQAGPKNGPRTWYTLRWNGRSWSERPITTSTHNYDLGSLLIDGKEWTVIGPTANGPQEHATGGNMVLWRSRDGGASWKAQQLTNDQERNHTYARRPVPFHDDFVAFWADGNGATASDSDLYFCNAKGQVFHLPRAMTADWEEPQPYAP